MGIQLLGKSYGIILKLLLFPIILYQFQKDPFCLIILYGILYYFTHVYIAPGQEETTLTICLMEAERSYYFDHWLHVSKIALPSDLCTLFCFYYYFIFIRVYSPWAWGRQPIRSKSLMSTGRPPHHFNHLLQV